MDTRPDGKNDHGKKYKKHYLSDEATLPQDKQR
jgi:hypothetical protein